MQADLGGAFYEMAIRDHVRLDADQESGGAAAGRRRAARGRAGARARARRCRRALSGCGAPYGHAVRFCAQCGHALVPTEAASETLAAPLPAGDGSGGHPDRQTVRPARRLLAGRHLGDRRRGDDQLQRLRAAGGAARPQPRRRPHAGPGRTRPPSPEPAPSSGGSPPAPAPAPASSSAPPSPEPTPAPEPAPAPNPNRPRPRLKRRPPKPAGSSTSSSSPWPAPATKPPSAPTPQMPYLATTLRPQGVLLSGYSLLDTAALPNAIAAIGGQPPTADTRPAARTTANASTRPKP